MAANDRPNTTKIFIYGTLKRGQCRAHVLDGQRFLRTAVTVPAYRMYDTGSYPAMVEDDNGVAIEGELWEVDEHCLQQLDSIEGTPHLYQRRTVVLSDPEIDDAQTYIYCQSVTGLVDCGSRWD